MNKPRIETILSNDLPLRGKGKELHSYCPFCSTDKKAKSDRLVVFVDKQRFWCRQCGASGDVIEYIQRRDGCDFRQACEVLGITLDGKPSTKQRTQSPARQKHEQVDDKRLSEKRQIGFDSESWRKSAQDYVESAQSSLWFDQSGEAGCDYLHSRGITDRRVWTYHGLGYSDRYKGTWGNESIQLPRGIVFPCEYDNLQVFKVNVRNMDNGKRYIQAKGSANVLFNGSRLTSRTPALLCEGEFDAISVSMAVSDPRLITPVATGSTSSSRIIDAVAMLAQCPRVYVAFDNEEAGDIATEWWLSMLDNAVRLRPTQKDINDMLLIDGTNGIRKWLGL